MYKSVNGKKVKLNAAEKADFKKREEEYKKELPIRIARVKISALEREITPRRLREAVLSEEGKSWLLEKEREIQELRNGISTPD